MTIRPDHDASIRFLRLLYPEGPWVLHAIHPMRQDPVTGGGEIRTRTYTDAAYARAFLDDYREYNLYYNVNPTVEPVDKKPYARQIARVCYFHVDVDPMNGEAPEAAWERIKAKLSHPPAGILPPTNLVQSGNGANALWKLAEPILVVGETDEEREASAKQIRGYNQQLQLLLSSDGGDEKADSVPNIDRILRLPGTLNWPTTKKIEKYGRTEPSLARLVFWDESRVYPTSKFYCMPTVVPKREAIASGPTRHRYQAPGNIEPVDLGSLPDSVPAEILLTIRDGKPPERFVAKWAKDRSRMVLWVLCDLIRRDVSDDKLYSIITDPTYAISAHVLSQKSNIREYAQRQIDRAHDMAIHEDLEWANRRYAAIKSIGGKTYVIEENYDGRGNIDFMTKDAFVTFYQNRYVKVKTTRNGKEVEENREFGEWWWRNEFRRSFDRMVYDPDEKCGPNVYNLWRGFSVVPMPGDWSMLRTMMWENLCQKDQEAMNYLLGWLAYGVQHPGQQGHTCVVLHGPEGSGKGTLAHYYGELWGPHYIHLLDGQQLVGRFRDHLRGKSFVFADEALFAGNHGDADVLKGLVTEKDLQVEGKYQRVTPIDNVLKILVASNKDWVIQLSKTDRRYHVINTGLVNQRHAEAQRKTVDRQMAEGGLSGFFYDLLHMDLSTFNIRDIPETEGRADQKLLSLNVEETWWHNKLYSGETILNHPWERAVPCSALMADYHAYHQMAGGRGKFLPDARLGAFIAEVQPGGKEARRMHQGKSCYQFPPLTQCRRHWETRMKSQFEWPGVVTLSSDDTPF